MTLLTRLRHLSSRRAYRVWRLLPNNAAWFWLPLCNVQGEIFKARNTASWGKSWRKEQAAIIKTVEDLTNQKGPKGLHFCSAYVNIAESVRNENDLDFKIFERCKHQRGIIRSNCLEKNNNKFMVHRQTLISGQLLFQNYSQSYRILNKPFLEILCMKSESQIITIISLSSKTLLSQKREWPWNSRCLPGQPMLKPSVYPKHPNYHRKKMQLAILSTHP